MIAATVSAPSRSSPGGCTATWTPTAPRHLPAVLRPRRGRTGLGRGRERVHRPHVQLRPDRAGPPHPAVDAAARGQRRDGDAVNGPGPSHGRAGRAAGRPGPARRLGDVRQERHRRHDAVPDHRPRGHRPPQGAGGRGAYHGVAPWCTPSAPARPPRTRQHHLFDYNDLASVEAAVRGRRAATSPRSSSRPTATTLAPTRSSSTRRSPAACATICDRIGRRADPRRRALRLPPRRWAAAGSRSASAPTSAPGARPLPTATRSPPCWAPSRWREAAGKSSPPARSGWPARPMAAALTTHPHPEEDRRHPP